MMADILLSLCVPFMAWVAYGRLPFFSHTAFRWTIAHVCALGWVQVGAEILLFLGFCTPFYMGIWLTLSLLWMRPKEYPKTEYLGLYALLVPYFLLALVPPWYRDSLTYHLTLPKLFAQHATYTVGDEIIFGYFPLGWHSILGSLFVFSPEPSEALFNPRLVSVWLSGAIAIGTAGLASMLGAARLWSWVCGICFLLIPTQIEFGTSAYVQTWLTLICLCAAGSVQEKQWIWVGICAGLAASAKYSGLFLCVLLIAILVQHRKHAKDVLIPMIIIGSPFYIRNLILKGNPLFPLAYSILGGEGWDEIRAEGYAQTLAHYGMGRDFFDYILLWPRVFLSQDLVFFFQGSLSPTIGIICLWGVLHIKKHTSIAIIGWGWALLWMFEVQQIRFLMPAIPILLALGCSSFGISKKFAPLFPISMMVWLCIPFQSLAQSLHPIAKPLYDAPFPFLWKRQHTTEHISQNLSQQEIYERMHSELAPLYKEMPKHEIRKVWLVWCRGFTYPLTSPFVVDSVFEGWRWEEALSQTKNRNEWKQFFSEMGVSHILINHKFFLSSLETEQQKNQEAEFQKLLQEKILLPIVQHQHVVLYQIESESESESSVPLSPQ